MVETERLMLPGQVARLLGVSHTRVLQLEKSCELPAAAKTDSGWRLFRRADVEAYLARRQAWASQAPPVPSA